MDRQIDMMIDRYDIYDGQMTVQYDIFLTKVFFCSKVVETDIQVIEKPKKINFDRIDWRR